jgi:hypothetical protein
MNTAKLSTLLLFSLAGCIDEDPSLSIDEAEILDGDPVSSASSGVPMISNDFALARVRNNGTPDPYFASGSGRVLTAFPGVTRAYADAVAIDSQQRIVLAGTADTAAGDVLAIARFTATGQLDATFAGDGRGVALGRS